MSPMARYTPLYDRYMTMKVNVTKLDNVDWSSFFELMKGHVHSVEFYNSDDKFSDVDQKLFLCLRNNVQMNEALTVLILKKIAFSENQIEFLCQAMCSARWLQHLSLQECALSDHCCRMICNSLRSVPSVSNIDLSGNNITEAGAKFIADLLKHEELARGISCWMGSLRGRIVDKKKVLGLSRLTLNDNPISDEGLDHIVERLYDDIWIKGRETSLHLEKDALKKMRDLDDKIVYALNINVPTPSFRSEINPSQTCKQLYDELQSNYQKRDLSIKKCINVTAVKIIDLKQKRDTSDDIGINKLINKEQTKLRMLKNELLVEEVVKDRSLKIYHERCREYFKPQSYTL